MALALLVRPIAVGLAAPTLVAKVLLLVSAESLRRMIRVTHAALLATVALALRVAHPPAMVEGRLRRVALVALVAEGR